MLHKKKKKKAPQSLRLSPFETLYGRPFLKNDLLLDQGTAKLTKYGSNLASFQKQLKHLKSGISQPKEDKRSLFNPGDLILIKTIPDNSPTLTSTWERSFLFFSLHPLLLRL